MRGTGRGKSPKGNESKVITDLESKGYKDTFDKFDSIEEAKERASSYRKEGYFARVVTATFSGKIYNRERIMVYIKKRLQK
jgi:hypothetical protein